MKRFSGSVTVNGVQYSGGGNGNFEYVAAVGSTTNLMSNILSPSPFIINGKKEYRKVGRRRKEGNECKPRTHYCA